MTVSAGEVARASTRGRDGLLTPSDRTPSVSRPPPGRPSDVGLRFEREAEPFAFAVDGDADTGRTPFGDEFTVAVVGAPRGESH